MSQQKVLSKSRRQRPPTEQEWRWSRAGFRPAAQPTRGAAGRRRLAHAGPRRRRTGFTDLITGYWPTSLRATAAARTGLAPLPAEVSAASDARSRRSRRPPARAVAVDSVCYPTALALMAQPVPRRGAPAPLSCAGRRASGTTRLRRRLRGAGRESGAARLPSRAGPEAAESPARAQQER